MAGELGTDDEREGFLVDPPPSRGSESHVSKVATKVSHSGVRRNTRNICIILLIGFFSLFGLAYWIAGRKESPPETIAETASATIREKSTNTLKQVLTPAEATPPEQPTAEMIPPTLKPEQSQSSAPSATTEPKRESNEQLQQSHSSVPSAPSEPQRESKKQDDTKNNNTLLGEPTFGSEAYVRQADTVIKTAMSAILEEYGQVPVGYYDDKADIHITPMFAWDRLNLTIATEAPVAFQNRGNLGNAGWTSHRSWKGLVLRLIQAMSKQGDFTVVLGGHSAAAGHGNHFHQSYLMQFHKVMAPVFRQLGVNIVSRNQAQGGLDTVQSSLGFSSIYGSEIDLMLWDSGMTENHSPEHTDLFFRQALMVKGRIPVVWGAGQKFDLLQMLHNEADADVGEFGIGWDGVPETVDEKLVGALPWAVQHLKCNEERPDLCKHPYKFCATCWIKRKDGIHPSQKQYEAPHGQVRWHPGWRRHQLTGRVLAFSVLQALQDAVEMIRSGNQEELRDAMDLTNYYENIRRKVQHLNPTLGDCNDLGDKLSGRICHTSMKGRTQYTPRANAAETSVSSILKRAPNGYVPRNHRKPLYKGPDAHNPCFDLPVGAVDVGARIEQLHNATTGSRHLTGSGFVTESDSAQRDSKIVSSTTTALENGQEAITNSVTLPSVTDTANSTTIIPGLGWQLFDEPQGICDGTYDSVCAKSTRNRCVLYGHHDERGSVLGSELSGWLVLQLPRAEIQKGIIILKLHTWYDPGDNGRTHGWTTVNNVPEIAPVANTTASDDGPQDRRLAAGIRSLKQRKYKTPPLDDWFQFEYAVDGVITTLDKKQFFQQKKDLGRMVELLTLLDDEAYVQRQQRSSSSVLEVSIRMIGCLRRCVFGVTHIYWA